MAVQTFTAHGRDGISSVLPRLNEMWPGGLKRSPRVALIRLDATATSNTSLIPSTGYNNSATTNVLDCEGFENVVGYFGAVPAGATRMEALLQLASATGGGWYDSLRASGAGVVLYVPDVVAFNTSGSFVRIYENLGARYARFRVRTPGGSAGSCVIGVQGFSLAGR